MRDFFLSASLRLLRTCVMSVRSVTILEVSDAAGPPNPITPPTALIDTNQNASIVLAQT